MLVLKRPIQFNTTTAFLLGWAVVMLSLTFSIGRPWNTFIHMWRVEFVASLFLAACIIFALAKRKTSVFKELGRSEVNFIVLPLLALIAWSALSMIWAPSWKSALHHSLVWSEYLIFFVFIRVIIESRKATNLLLAMLVACLAFASIPAFWGYVSYQIFGGGLLTGVIFAKSGEQITTLLPLIILGAVRLKGSKFAYGAAGIGSLWLLILCGFGRINMILFLGGFILTSGYLWVRCDSRSIRRRLVAIVAVLVAIPCLLYIGAKLSAPYTETVADRIVGNEFTQSSNSFRILMTTLSIEMIRSNPIHGVGADNFGFQLNNYRADYGLRNPDDPNLALAESEIPERAHNELLQIAAELGIVGVLIVAWLLMGIGLMAIRAVRLRRYSLYGLAAYLGLLIFLASSLVSSYSFRLIQNGFIFFFLLAICSRYFLRDRSDRVSESGLVPNSRIAAALGLSACLLLAAYSAVRVSSVIAARIGDDTHKIDDAENYYRTAIDLDNENPNASETLGMRLFFEKRFSDAIPFLKNSIEIGKATSTDFSYLASAYTLSGDNEGAEKTMMQAAAMYPRSVFILVRFAMLARANGNNHAASEALERARSINPRAANSWVELIANGPLRASEQAFKDKDSFVPVMDLLPNQAVYAILDEQEIHQTGGRRKVGL